MKRLSCFLIAGAVCAAALAGPNMSGPHKRTLASMFAEGAARWARKPFVHRYGAVDKLPPKGWFTVDISGKTNMGFYDEKGGDLKGGWIDMGPRYSLQNRLKPGKKVYYGVPFDVIDPAKNNGTSCIVFRSERFHAKRFPRKVVFPVGRKCAYLYFLHASAWSTWGNTHRYVVRYEDGSEREIMVRPSSRVIRQGENILDWHSSTPLETPGAKPIPLVDPTGRDTSLRFLYTLQWRNPSPAKTVKQIEVDAGEKQLSVLILLAITGNTGS